METLTQVIGRQPVSPHALNPEVDRDLETVCLKCLQRAPECRYATARDLADDLGHRHVGEPVVVRPVSRIGRTWRWCRRNPVVASLSGVVQLGRRRVRRHLPSRGQDGG